MSFRENLRRGRSHILLIVVMIAAASFVVATEDDALTRETGKRPSTRPLPLPALVIKEREVISKDVERLKKAASLPVAQIGAYANLKDAQLAATTAGERLSQGSVAAVTRIDSPVGGSGFYRLVLVPREGTPANQVCSAWRDDGGECFVRVR